MDRDQDIPYLLNALNGAKLGAAEAAKAYHKAAERERLAARAVEIANGRLCSALRLLPGGRCVLKGKLISLEKSGEVVITDITVWGERTD